METVTTDVSAIAETVSDVLDPRIGELRAKGCESLIPPLEALFVMRVVGAVVDACRSPADDRTRAFLGGAEVLARACSDERSAQ